MKGISVFFCFIFIILLHSSTLYAASAFIGMNTNEAVHFDSSLPFVDLFRTSEPFTDSSYTRGNVQYDGNGWVRNLNGGQAGSFFIRWIPEAALPRGNYTVLYQGKGMLVYPEGVKIISRQTGKDIIQLVANPKNREVSAALVVRQSDPRDPIRNIQVLMPGGICQGNAFQHVMNEQQCGGRRFLAYTEHATDIVFNPDYLQFMRQFRTIRFMNMSGITRNAVQQVWRQRPHLQQATWGGKEGKRGVPVEIMVKLANQINANAWFNMPHRANNDYIRQYAQYVKTNLRPHLKAYIEYTNEAWNEAFSQAKYIRQMGMRQRLAKDPIMAGIQFYALRSKQIFQIWEQTFGGTQRLVRVIGGWAGRPDLTPYFLKFAEVYKYTDVFAIAPYFYAHAKEINKVRNVNDVFNLLNGEQPYGIDATIKKIQTHAKLIQPYKVRLVAYEGGQHLVSYSTKSINDYPNPILSAANKDRRMETAYIKLLQGFKRSGGLLFVAFSSPRPHAFYGFWGIKEHIRQPNAQAPKLRALQRF